MSEPSNIVLESTNAAKLVEVVCQPGTNTLSFDLALRGLLQSLKSGRGLPHSKTLARGKMTL